MDSNGKREPAPLGRMGGHRTPPVTTGRHRPPRESAIPAAVAGGIGSAPPVGRSDS